MRLEVCVADPASLVAAVEGGADRIELCSALEVGGLTPSPGLLGLAAQVEVPTYVLIRPRAGDFVFNRAEIDSMLGDIAAVRDLGLAGVVLGASHPDGTLDTAVLAELVGASTGLGLTLHRAFDLVPDLAPAVELAVRLGFERILTSGRAPTAARGIADLRQAYDLARGRLSIMAGSGVNADTVGTILQAVPLGEVHASCSAALPVSAPAVTLGFGGPTRRQTTAAEVQRLRSALAAST